LNYNPRGINVQCKFTEDFLDEIPGMEILIKIELKNHEK
jgi:hypothetical protein